MHLFVSSVWGGGGRVNRVCLYKVLLTALFAAAVLLRVPALVPGHMGNRTVSLALSFMSFPVAVIKIIIPSLREKGFLLLAVQGYSPL